MLRTIIASLLVLIFVLSIKCEEYREDKLLFELVEKESEDARRPGKPPPPKPTKCPSEKKCFRGLMKCYRKIGNRDGCIEEFKICCSENMSPQAVACLLYLRQCLKDEQRGLRPSNACFIKFKRCLRNKPGPESGSGMAPEVY